MKDIDVLLLTYADWSDLGWKNSQCLKSLGLNVVMYKGQPHSFNYPEQAPIYEKLFETRPICDRPTIVNAPFLKGLVERAKVIYFVAETYINTGVNLKNKKVVVDFGGSTYRNYPEQCNAVFNQFSDASIILYPTLLNKGANNEQYVTFPVDTDFLQPCYKKKSGKIIIGHFPSSTWTKGTGIITSVISELQSIVGNKFEYIGTTLPKSLEEVNKSAYRSDWLDNLKRIEQCDVLIEAVQPEIDGKPFGEWGNQALEAAALGKIVVTNSIYQDIYKKEYGDSEICVANDAIQLKDRLTEILNMDYDSIVAKQKATRAWVVEKHSYSATAKRLWEKVFKQLLPNTKVNIGD